MAPHLRTGRKGKRGFDHDMLPDIQPRRAQVSRNKDKLLIIQKRHTAAHEDTVPASDHTKAKRPDLPGEVLSNILGHLLVREIQPVHLRSGQKRYWENELKSLQGDCSEGKTYSSQLLKILLVNKAFYFAGIEEFYGGNDFAFPTFTHLRNFLNTLDVDRKGSIKKITVTIRVDRFADYCDAEDTQLFSTDLAMEIPGLEKLTVIASIKLLIKSRYGDVEDPWLSAKLGNSLQSASLRKLACSLLVKKSDA